MNKLSQWLQSSILTNKPQQNTSEKPKKHPSKFSSTSTPSTSKKRGSDPFFHRPTAEKRDKFHPVNYLQPHNAGEIRVVPLGGLEQVGANIMFLQWEDDIIIIDTGFVFPETRSTGVDFLLPNIEYLVKHKKNIRGVIYTHGHLDHIGGAPYILPQLGYPPVYTSRLTKEMILANTEDPSVSKNLKFHEITTKSKIKLGRFEVEFFHINHSIPDGLAVVVNTPYGAIVHTSDFKLDYRPSDDQPIDLGRIAQVGSKGVLLAMADSTSTQREGKTVSESTIMETLNDIVVEALGRIIIATFASNIGRISKIVEIAEKEGRTVFISGRSMEKNIAIASKLNYLRCKEKTIQVLRRNKKKIDALPPEKVLILSTGSQGEEFSALSRMSQGVHADIELSKEDTIVFSSSPIPGNEISVTTILNNLARIECKVIDDADLDTHVSGHGSAEDSKMMISLLNPKCFTPIHGEVHMRYDHKNMIIKELNFPENNTFIMNNGEGISVKKSGVSLIPATLSLSSDLIPYQNRKILGQKSLEIRENLAKSGLVIVKIMHSQGIVKNVNIKPIGSLYSEDLKHPMWKEMEKEIREKFTKNFSSHTTGKAMDSILTKALTPVFLKYTGTDLVLELIF